MIVLNTVFRVERTLLYKYHRNDRETYCLQRVSFSPTIYYAALRRGVIIIPTQNIFVAKRCKNKRFRETQNSKHNIILRRTIHIYKCRIVL